MCMYPRTSLRGHLDITASSAVLNFSKSFPITIPSAKRTPRYSKLWTACSYEIFVIHLTITDTIGKHVSLITLNKATPRADAMTKLLQLGRQVLARFNYFMCLINPFSACLPHSGRQKLRRKVPVYRIAVNDDPHSKLTLANDCV
jgi:hypothetical protein